VAVNLSPGSDIQTTSDVAETIEAELQKLEQVENYQVNIGSNAEAASTGFVALGIGRASALPAVVLCTSGTAAANLHPAVVEAHQGRVPLLVCTADRPPELQGFGAPQTIDQLKLFGDHVRHFAELGLPDPAPTSLRAAARIAAQSVARSLGPTPGPVHVTAATGRPSSSRATPGRRRWS